MGEEKYICSRIRLNWVNLEHYAHRQTFNKQDQDVHIDSVNPGFLSFLHLFAELVAEHEVILKLHDFLLLINSVLLFGFGVKG